MKKTLIAMIAFTFVFVPLSYAQQKTRPKVDMEQVRKNQAIHDLTTLIDERSNRAEKKHFRTLYGNFNMIETVDAVRNDVKAAVQSCGDKNPAIKDKMNTRYSEWDGALDPIMIEARANIDNMIMAQEYASKDEIEKVLEGLREMRKESNDMIKKIPVTTEEACLFLHGKMDETEDNLLSMLKATLVSFPRSFQDENQQETQDIAKDTVAMPNGDTPDATAAQ